MILITGATGTIGSHVTRLLAGRGEPVRVLVRDPARAPAAGEVVRADYDDPGSLARAFDGVTTAFLATAFGSALPRHDLAMVEAARVAGVKKVVKLSAIPVSTRDGADPGAWHRPGEEAMEASGMAWTLLRPAGFASNSLAWAGAVASGTPIPNFTGDGAQPVVDPRDVAAVAVAALTSPGHESRAHDLTGPAMLSVPDQLAILGRLLGRTLETVDVPVEAARQQMLAAGADPVLAGIASSGWTMLKEGGSPGVTGTVEAILGRPAASYETWAEAHLTAFTRS
ncbi:NAD(P)H-binding protein [Nonomuraea sp. SBT364]|uniref:NAD(P)H-binding protein n=1 Tax=Nonomuraea sp. SBT364 TaxID=1580530 RepID=UPI00066C5C6F|nr:NAD(P)H-binding protein [Nonomuraea sp. SBT364]